MTQKQNENKKLSRGDIIFQVVVVVLVIACAILLAAKSVQAQGTPQEMCKGDNGALQSCAENTQPKKRIVLLLDCKEDGSHLFYAAVNFPVLKSGSVYVGDRKTEKMGAEWAWVHSHLIEIYDDDGELLSMIKDNEVVFVIFTDGKNIVAEFPIGYNLAVQIKSTAWACGL